MLAKPATCQGCPLERRGTGFMQPHLGRKPVWLVGEALGEHEAERGEPFVGPAGYFLQTLLSRAGIDRADVSLINAVWCRPPGNRLEGEAYEQGAVAHCRRQHWAPLVRAHRPAVLVPLGNVALAALTGMKGIQDHRGYVEWAADWQAFILPTLHPSFVLRGNTHLGGVVLHDLQRAMDIAAHGWTPAPTAYCLDPTPREALAWAEQALAASTRLAFDVETTGKHAVEDELDLARTGELTRIGFAAAAGQAMSVPWEAAYLPAIRLLLDSPQEKVAWNKGFDLEALAQAGVPVRGRVHDGMVAWHVLNSDLPKSLAFVATFLCPQQPRWKHLSEVDPAGYNATDADVTWQAMTALERLLRQHDLWAIYERHVLRLEPVLTWMSAQGLPVDASAREAAARLLTERLRQVRDQMQAVVPASLRRLELRTRPPATLPDGAELEWVTVEEPVRVCARCRQPATQTHVRRKRDNPCHGATLVTETRQVRRPAIRHAFVPSPQQVQAYVAARRHQLPLREGTTNEKALRRLVARYPKDPVYRLVLAWRELQKLAGTYVGYLDESL